MSSFQQLRRLNLAAKIFSTSSAGSVLALFLFFTTNTSLADLEPFDGTQVYNQEILPLLISDCMDCHSSSGVDPFASLKTTLKYVRPGFPGKSRLFLNAEGNPDHLGIWANSPKNLEALAVWIVRLRYNPVP